MTTDYVALTRAIRDLTVAQDGWAEPKPERNHAREQAAAHLSSIIDAVGRYNRAYDVISYAAEAVQETLEDAEQTILEMPLSILYRTGWAPHGGDDWEPEEFEILLSTGGPAVRIVGDIDSGGEPSDARLEYQDWGTPWTEYLPAREYGDTLDRFAAVLGVGAW